MQLNFKVGPCMSVSGAVWRGVDLCMPITGCLYNPDVVVVMVTLEYSGPWSLFHAP